MSKIAILPDIHGRQFWKTVKEHADDFDKIVFLGDYVSPYPSEDISNEQALDVFREVLDFKKEKPEKVILLIGNHDLSYYNIDICECRTDYVNWNKLNKLYLENNKLFDIAWETEINGKRYFFSHSGVRKGWLNCISGGIWFDWDNVNELPPAEMFNDAFHLAYNVDLKDQEKIRTLRRDFEHLIGVYSTYRGWGGWDYGSIVWADIREYNEPEFDDVVFVCGHTQLENEPIIKGWVMDLDCRKPFVLDTETGNVKEFKENE